MKKFSILGVVLVAASAVTAAVLPSKGSSDKSMVDQNPNGTITTSSTPLDGLGTYTCAPKNSTGAATCHISATGSTNNGGTDEYTTA